MRNNERKLERRAAREAELERMDRLRCEEESRKAALNMWERIEDADASPDVKEILHMMAYQLGLEL